MLLTYITSSCRITSSMSLLTAVKVLKSLARLKIFKKQFIKIKHVLFLNKEYMIRRSIKLLSFCFSRFCFHHFLKDFFNDGIRAIRQLSCQVGNLRLNLNFVAAPLSRKLLNKIIPHCNNLLFLSVSGMTPELVSSCLPASLIFSCPSSIFCHFCSCSASCWPRPSSLAC